MDLPYLVGSLGLSGVLFVVGGILFFVGRAFVVPGKKPPFYVEVIAGLGGFLVLLAIAGIFSNLNLLP